MPVSYTHLEIVLTSSSALRPEAGRIYYRLSDLAALTPTVQPQPSVSDRDGQKQEAHLPSALPAWPDGTVESEKMEPALQSSPQPPPSGAFEAEKGSPAEEKKNESDGSPAALWGVAAVLAAMTGAGFLCPGAGALVAGPAAREEHHTDCLIRTAAIL